MFNSFSIHNAEKNNRKCVSMTRMKKISFYILSHFKSFSLEEKFKKKNK